MRLQDVELRALLEVVDQLGRIGRLGLVHRLHHGFERDVLAPCLVFRRLAVLLAEGRDEGLGARGIDIVVPDHRPSAGEVVGARAPSDGGIKAETGRRIGQAKFGVLLDEIGDLVARQIGNHQVGLGLADFQQIGAEVGGVGRHQFVLYKCAAIGSDEDLCNAQQVMAKRIVGGQAKQLFALDHVGLHQRLAAGLDIGGVGAFDVKHVLVAAFAAQFVGIAAGVDENALVAARHLCDRQTGGRGNFTDQHDRAIALEQALRLGRSGGGIDRVFRDQFKLATHDAAGPIDLLDRHGDAHHGIFTERAEEAGQRRQMADLDFVGLRTHDCGKAQTAQAGHARERRRPGEQLAATG